MISQKRLLPFQESRPENRGGSPSFAQEVQVFGREVRKKILQALEAQKENESGRGKIALSKSFGDEAGRM